MELKQEIRRLAQQKHAVIMAHYYQRPEVQDVADYIGDSLALAQTATKTDAEMIVLCGVHFMAETAAILCPDKKVLIPDPMAGCSLADSCDADELRQWKTQHPDYQIISYVNTSAKVKALTDVVVTSSNALTIVQSFPENAKLLFGPDQNLGRYINDQTGRHMELWHGGCHVHGRYDVTALVQLKQRYPDAAVLAHPECPQTILQYANLIGSTQALLNYATRHTEQSCFIIITELGVIHKMQQARQDAQFISVPKIGGGCNECEYMRQITLQKLYDCLLNETGQVVVDPEIADQALQPIQKMLALSK